MSVAAYGLVGTSTVSIREDILRIWLHDLKALDDKVERLWGKRRREPDAEVIRHAACLRVDARSN